MTSDISPASTKHKCVIVGVGEGGINIVNHMIDNDIHNVDYVAVHAYSMFMEKSKASTKIFIGENMPKGLGMLATPELCERLAMENKELLKDNLRGAGAVIIVTGLGGNVGTGVASVIADCAHEVGALAIALVTITFEFEGARRRNKAKTALSKLKNHANSTLIFPLDSLLDIIDKKISITKAFHYANRVIMLAAQTIQTQILASENGIDIDSGKNIFPYEGVVLISSPPHSDEQPALINSEEDIDVKVIEGSHLKYIERYNPPHPTMGVPSYIPRESDTNTDVDSVFIDIPGWMWKHPPKKQESNKKDVQHINEERRPRSDGRQLCNDLREMRIELAEVNNIPFESKECTYDGPCSGTCPKCDEEAAYLRDKLAEIPADKRKYPERKIREMVDII